MLKVGTKTDYAVRGLAYMATLSEGAIVTCDEIVEAIKVPRESFALLLKALAKEKLILSFRGTGGGFTLGRHPSKISLLDIINITEGKFVINQCLADEVACDRKSNCIVHSVWRGVQEKLVEICSRIKLDEIAGIKP